MTTIADISDEPKYTIKAVSAKTGIRPVTLRAWERRHELLSPFRSDNRYRFYSERDVAILRWIKERVDSGISISSAATELRSMIHNGVWPDVIPSPPVLEPVRKTNLPPDQFVNPLYLALIKHDEITSSDILREIQKIFDLNILFERILIPVLVKIGEGWYRGEIRVTTEHFASSYLRGKLLTLYQSFPTRRGAAYIMVGCGPNEQHEIGGLMLAVLLRSSGFRVEYLGPDIPIEDLVDYASYEHPNMIILSASIESAALELEKAQEKLNHLKPAVAFGYGGMPFNQKPDLRKRIQGIFLGATITDAATTVREMFTREAVVPPHKVHSSAPSH